MTELPLSDELVELLLSEDEGAALDFKRDAYPFENAEPHQKAELLKDVLAFANAFRRATAYILIGVEDVAGGRCIVHGVDRHPDDASLQQFVNGKTNRPVEFRYRARTVDGKQVGIIEIPVQTRPLYLNKDYVGLKAYAVYVRRSSSTDVASPDEVARMGASVPAAPSAALDVALGDAEADSRLGLHLSASTLSYRLPTPVPDYVTGMPMPGGGVLDIGDGNKAYWREMVAYARDLGRLRSFQVAVDNVGSVPLLGGRLVVRVPRSGGVLLADHRQSRPSTSQYGYLAGLITKPDPHAWAIVERGDDWEASASAGTVLPGDTAWSPELFVGADESGRYALDLAVLGENLPEPLRLKASITLNVRRADLTLDAVRAWHDTGSLPPDLFP